MIKFYTNRQLAEGLDINLARWKRWSREFLPPDPLGGMQSGYARQYSPDEAFVVFLGGNLVSELKFTIPEAKQILYDLQQWLRKKGFLYDIKGNAAIGSGIDAMVQKYFILIRCPKKSFQKDMVFGYNVKGIISNKPVQHRGFEIMEELYAEETFGSQKNRPADPHTETVKTLDITGVLNTFVASLNLDRIHYPAL